MLKKARGVRRARGAAAVLIPQEAVGNPTQLIILIEFRQKPAEMRVFGLTFGKMRHIILVLFVPSDRRVTVWRGVEQRQLVRLIT